jgi:hypothetical protein
MNRSDVQENLFSLYLRLNGYFVTGFIVHADLGNKTEMDALAVRFPYHNEPEREIGLSPVLDTSNLLLDFLVCEVKGGKRNVNFNVSFREDTQAIASVLRRFGAFTDKEIQSLTPNIQAVLCPDKIRNSQEYPTLDIPRINSRLRFLLVAPDQNRSVDSPKPYIYGNDMIQYIWNCFRPDVQRQSCGVRYNWSLWGEQYIKLVRYFKDKKRTAPGDIDSIYAYFELPALDTAKLNQLEDGDSAPVPL